MRNADAAIAAGRIEIALITVAGNHPRTGSLPEEVATSRRGPERPFENCAGGMYALAAMRVMHEYGATWERLAEIKVAKSLRAQHNPNATQPVAMTVDEVLWSPMVAGPPDRLDCCVIARRRGSAGRHERVKRTRP